MRYDIVLWDIDNTLLDFNAALSQSMRICMARCGMPQGGRDVSDGEIALFDRINRKYWEMLERGEITKRELEAGRFREFLAAIGAEQMDALKINDDFKELLGQVAVCVDGAQEICARFHDWGVRQYAVTNGAASVQRSKIALSGLDRFFEELFISEELGAVKPQKAFFEQCAARIPNYRSDRALMIGDSVTSDMRGGYHAGIDCCWYNPAHVPCTADFPIQYEITHLREAAEIVMGED